MKKILVTMMAFTLTIAAQGQTETIDTSKFVVTYDYAVQTKMGIDDREIVRANVWATVAWRLR